MVDQASLMDKVHLQKYIYVMKLFLSKKMAASVFEEIFLQIRNDDSYWMSGSFEPEVGKIMDTFFLDVSDYAPDELYDSKDPNDINEAELYRRAGDVLSKLNEFCAD